MPESLSLVLVERFGEPRLVAVVGQVLYVRLLDLPGDRGCVGEEVLLVPESSESGPGLVGSNRGKAG